MPFHPAVILLNDFVDILAQADRDNPQLSILGPKLANGPMGGLVSVEVIVRGSHPCVLTALRNGFGGGCIHGAILALLEFWRIMLDPAQNGARRDGAPRSAIISARSRYESL
jgi:hypothetical protein